MQRRMQPGCHAKACGLCVKTLAFDPQQGEPTEEYFSVRQTQEFLSLHLFHALGAVVLFFFILLLIIIN